VGTAVAAKNAIEAAASPVWSKVAPIFLRPSRSILTRFFPLRRTHGRFFTTKTAAIYRVHTNRVLILVEDGMKGIIKEEKSTAIGSSFLLNLALEVIMQRIATVAARSVPRLGRTKPAETALFVCDIQQKFKDVIFAMPSVIHVAKHMVRMTPYC
jgi:hypothetical protein